MFLRNYHHRYRYIKMIFSHNSQCNCILSNIHMFLQPLLHVPLRFYSKARSYLYVPNNALLNSNIITWQDCHFKGKANEIFCPQFFSSFELTWATDQWVKIFSFFVSFFAEIFEFYLSSAQYHTAWSHSTFPYPF